ncbi:MAG: hypothetical protein AB7T37_09275 [Dehalococcoidia bacterium]
MEEQDPSAITWERSIRIIPNPYVLKEKLIIDAIVLGVFALMFWVIGWLVFGTPFSREAVLLAGVISGITAALLVVVFAAWVVAAGNHIPASHTLDQRGAVQRRPARWYAGGAREIAAWESVRGNIGGRQAWAGIGAEDADGVNWPDVKQVRVDRGRHVIELRKGRFELVRLYCPEEPGRFEEILDIVQARVAAARA